MAATIHVCVTCRAGQPVTEGQPCAGARLHAALSAYALPDEVQLATVECLGACERGCTVAFSQPGGWSYIYGQMSEEDAPEVLRGAALYAHAAEGLVPWQERPAILRKRGIARLPPTGTARA